VKSGGEFLQVWFPGLSNKRLLKLHPYENSRKKLILLPSWMLNIEWLKFAKNKLKVNVYLLSTLPALT
jgi:hypothetical protein